MHGFYQQLICILLISSSLPIFAQQPAALSNDQSTAKTTNLKLQNLPLEIQQIKTLCPWRSKQGKGIVRVIYSQEKQANRLYLQWIKSATATTVSKLLSSITVQELQTTDYRFSMPSQIIRDNSCTLISKAFKLPEKRPYRLYIRLSGFGQYQFSQRQILADGEH